MVRFYTALCRRPPVHAARVEFLATVLGTGGTTTGIEVPAEVVEGAKAAETRARRVAGVVAAVTG